MRELPGVDAATVAQRMPLGFDGTSDFGVKVDGYTPAANEEIIVYYNRVGSDYLRTMGIGVVEGRDFTDRDTAESTGRHDRQRNAGPSLLRGPRGDRRPHQQSASGRCRSSASRATASTRTSPSRRARSCTCRCSNGIGRHACSPSRPPAIRPRSFPRCTRWCDRSTRTCRCSTSAPSRSTSRSRYSCSG